MDYPNRISNIFRFISVLALLALVNTSCLKVDDTGAASAGTGGGSSSPGSSSGGSDGGSTSYSTKDFEVPIEMTHARLFGDVVDISADATRTEIDTTKYDGTVTYVFEAVADDGGGGAGMTVWLVDSTGTAKATLSFPTGMTAQRLRTTFTPNSGSDTYRIKIGATDDGFGSGSGSVTNARIIIQQVGASKTRIYFPLYTGNDTQVVYNNPALTTTRTTYGEDSGNAGFYKIWKYDSTYLKDLASGSPLTLEMVVGHYTAGQTVSAILYNKTAGANVTGSEATSTIAATTTINRATASFSASATNFADGAEYIIRFITSAGTAKLYKAGIWVEIGALDKGEVCYQVARSGSLGAGTACKSDSGLVYLDTSLFTSPTFYFENSGSDNTSNHGGTYALRSQTTSDLTSGCSGGSNVASSSVGFTVLTGTPAYERVLSSAITPTSQYRYSTHYTMVGVNSRTAGACILIRF